MNIFSSQVKPFLKEGKKIFVNGEQTTIKDAMVECRKILSDPGELTGESLLYVASLLIARKSDYAAPIKIEVGLGSDGIYNCFYYQQQSGQWDDFSYRKTLSDRKRDNKQEILRAFRYEIREQIIQYRRSNSPVKKGMHVDRVVPFLKLVNDFLKSLDLPLENIELEKISHEEKMAFKFYRKKLKDRQMARAWQQDHKQYAKLQIIPAVENLKKSKYIPDVPDETE